MSSIARSITQPKYRDGLTLVIDALIELGEALIELRTTRKDETADSADPLAGSAETAATVAPDE